MSTTVSATEPTELYAGDSLRWNKTLPALPADVWTLTYRILASNSLAAITITATADGTDHAITVGSSTTATWGAGDYFVSGFATSGDERVQVYSGTLKVMPDPSTASFADRRSWLQRTIAKLEELIENGLIREPVRYTYGGQSTDIMSLEDAMNARDRLKAELLQVTAQSRRQSRLVLTKFTRPL